MKEINRKFGEIILFKTPLYSDNRGHFFEAFNENIFEKLVGEKIHFVQDNCSVSKKGVIRGMHYQVVKPQGKLVRVLAGSVYDVVVDLRKDSPTFKQWAGFELTAINAKALWIPGGFAHGFMALEEDSILLYKVTDYWYKEHDRSLLWNDKDVAIKWPEDKNMSIIISQKDLSGTSFNEAEYF